jgi:hypothetical protein
VYNALGAWALPVLLPRVRFERPLLDALWTFLLARPPSRVGLTCLPSICPTSPSAVHAEEPKKAVKNAERGSRKEGALGGGPCLLALTSLAALWVTGPWRRGER